MCYTADVNDNTITEEDKMKQNQVGAKAQRTTRNMAGAKKHSQGSGQVLPFWMLMQHSLDSLNFWLVRTKCNLRFSRGL